MFRLGKLKGRFEALFIKKPRTFFFFHSSSIGGAERVHLDLLTHIEVHNPTVVIAENRSERGWEENFKAVSMWYYDISESQKNRRKFHFYLGYFSELINRSDTRLVLGSASYFFYRLVPFLKVKNRVNLLHALVEKHEKGFEHYTAEVFEHIDKTIVLNESIKNNFISFLHDHKIKTNPQSVAVVDNCVEFFYEDYRADKNNLNILFVGRESEEKRVFILKDIIKKASTRIPNLTFTLVGSDFESIKNEELNNVNILGKIYDKKRLNEIYKQTDILIITSRREGFPLVIQEAMATSNVPLSTNVGGIPHHIKNNENGILISSDQSDQEIIESFLSELEELSKNQNKLSELKKTAYQYAKMHFSVEKFKESYKRVLEL
jgi:glycosyltransferase involved in cell wall biosynthesis